MSKKKDKREKKETEIIDEDCEFEFQEKEKENKYYSLEDKIDEMALKILPKLKEYIRENSLCIGENLDYLDLMNLIEYLYKG